MARTCNPFKRLALLALLCCTGCASHRTGNSADTGGPPISLDGNSIAGSYIQDASAASLNNWNFRRIGW